MRNGRLNPQPTAASFFFFRSFVPSLFFLFLRSRAINHTVVLSVCTSTGPPNNHHNHPGAYQSALPPLPPFPNPPPNATSAIPMSRTATPADASSSVGGTGE